MSPKPFTIEREYVANSLVTHCGICDAFNPKDYPVGLEHPPVGEFEALWDTGATGSVISKNVVQKLGLKATGKAIVYHANGKSSVDVYSVNVLLPNNVGFYALKVTEGVLNDIDVLIGMDIISMGDFAITSAHGRTKFSFQIPSTHDIDFAREHNQKAS